MFDYSKLSELVSPNYYYGLSIVTYVVSALSFFFLSKKAKVRKPWIAFIPVLQFIKFFHIIDRRAWNIFLVLIPGVNIVLCIIWAVKFYKAFDVSTVLIVLSIIIPVIGWIVDLVMAFSPRYTYVITNRFTA